MFLRRLQELRVQRENVLYGQRLDLLRRFLLPVEAEGSVRDLAPVAAPQLLLAEQALRQLAAERALQLRELIALHGLQLRLVGEHTVLNGLGDLSAGELGMRLARRAHGVALEDHHEVAAALHAAEEGPHDVAHLLHRPQLVEHVVLQAVREQPQARPLCAGQLPQHAGRAVHRLGVPHALAEERGARRDAADAGQQWREGAQRGPAERLHLLNQRLHGGEVRVAHGQPLEARGGDEVLLAMTPRAGGNGELADLREGDGMGLEVGVALFHGPGGGVKEAEARDKDMAGASTWSCRR